MGPTGLGRVTYRGRTTSFIERLVSTLNGRYSSIVCSTAMSQSRILLAATLALSTVTVHPRLVLAQPQEVLATLVTPSGKTYLNAEVLAVEPDGLRLRHDAGVSKVAFADLPASLASCYPHDPVKAAEFAASAEAANRVAILLGEQERARAEFDERCRLAGLPPGFVIPEEGPLTIAQVKGRWLLDNVARIPTFGERDRHIQEEMIAFRKAEILSGARDREAEEVSLRHNLDWYLHNGKTAEADVARKRLADMQAEVSKQAELALLERLAGAVSQLASETAYRSDMAAELARFRCELERVHQHGHGHQHHGKVPIPISH